MHWDTYFYFAVPKADFWRGLHQEQLSPRPSLPITRKWQQASAIAEQNACKFRDRSLCLAAASKEIFLIELGSKCVKRSPFPLRTFLTGLQSAVSSSFHLISLVRRCFLSTVSNFDQTNPNWEWVAWSPSPFPDHLLPKFPTSTAILWFWPVLY